MSEETKKLFGKLSVDKDVEKLRECRHIVRTIAEYGVDDKQIITIMRLLALEMEDYARGVELVNAIKEIGGSYFLTEKFENGQETE